MSNPGCPRVSVYGDPKPTAREQSLVDIMFEVALMISDPRFDLRDRPLEEKAAWVAKMLKECGFKTTPIGSSWGVLK